MFRFRFEEARNNFIALNAGCVPRRHLSPNPALVHLCSLRMFEFKLLSTGSCSPGHSCVSEAC